MDGFSLFGSISKQKQLDYFLTVPELFTVYTTKARMFAKMRLSYEFDATGKDVPLSDPIQKLLQTPNWWESQKEFLIRTKLFREIYGQEFIYILHPVGLPKSVKQISTLDPLTTEIIEPDNKTPKPFTLSSEGYYYKYTEDNKEYKIDYEDILHLNSTNVRDKTNNGLSNTDVLKPNLDNIIAAYESRGHILRNRGPLVLLSNNSKDGLGATTAVDAKEKTALQDDYKRYGTLKNQWTTLITSLNLTSQQIGANIKDLMLFEEIEADFDKICDVVGFNSLMFSSKKGSTFENAKRYEKQAYQNTIIPEANEWVQGLNSKFQTQGTGKTIHARFEDLASFEEDKKERATALKFTTSALSQQLADGVITAEEYKKELERFE